MIGKAVAHGAVTIVNAIACDLGAALGVKLWTKATVELTDKPGEFEGRIISDPNENTGLMINAARRVLNYFGVEGSYGAYVETESNIPIARGLKSSSVAANAVVLAVAAALNKKVDDLTAVKLGVEAAIKSRVTITGAFDDACASYFGNLVVTDNKSMKIMKSFEVNEKDYRVLIYVPPEKGYTANVKVEKVRVLAKEVEVIHKLALLGDYWTAMTLNGLVYSVVLGYNPKIALEALMNGAVAAGLSGTGPAVAAITSAETIDKIVEAWQKYEGEIIQTEINSEKAHVLK
ncbi:MAG: shikimate kinase [Candidatus Bathyarchaeia archaeon]